MVDDLNMCLWYRKVVCLQCSRKQGEPQPTEMRAADCERVRGNKRENGGPEIREM